MLQKHLHSDLKLQYGFSVVSKRKKIDGLIRDNIIKCIPWLFLYYFLLTEATGFTLRFQEADDIVLTDGANNVTDHGAALSFTDDFNTNLGDTTTGAGTAKALGNTGVFNLLLY